MSLNSDRSVVLGAGPLGAAVFRQLQTQGKTSQMYSVMGNPAYDMPGTHPDATDGFDPTQVREVCSGADIIYLCMNAHYVDWYEKFPQVLDATLEAGAAAGARLIYADNMHVYGPQPHQDGLFRGEAGL